MGRGAIVNNVVLVKRSGFHKHNIPILTFGFEVKQKDYLVGCGLDYNGEYRKLPYIASVKEENA
jgi:hypoxanthine-guanine phosphoribosyltransferase